MRNVGLSNVIGIKPAKLSDKKYNFSRKAYKTGTKTGKAASSRYKAREDSDLESPYVAIFFQFFARYSAVRHAIACSVSVGFRAPLAPMTDAPRIPRFGASCEKPQPLTTLVSGLEPMRVPP